MSDSPIFFFQDGKPRQCPTLRADDLQVSKQVSKTINVLTVLDEYVFVIGDVFFCVNVPSPPATIILPRMMSATKSARFVFMEMVSSDFNQDPAANIFTSIYSKE